ncbi:hypothetical protein CLOM_g9444 [Closterium sp. NIES-68]|nr:hypothetical protein CLOM_g9444 [Closterium sp. NIES-68]GJP59323.1 hypothetical protein CLOP_g10418 [Closterium sp. NIES-67]
MGRAFPSGRGAKGGGGRGASADSAGRGGGGAYAIEEIRYAAFTADGSHVAVATSAGFKIFHCADVAQPVVSHLGVGPIKIVELTLIAPRGATPLVAFVGTGETPHISPRELHLASITGPAVSSSTPTFSPSSPSSSAGSPLTHHTDPLTHTHAPPSSSSLAPLGVLSFLTSIVAVRLNHSRLLVLLGSKLSIHDVTPPGIAAGFPLLLSLTVAPNPKGICALSPLSPRPFSPASSCFCAVPAAPARTPLLSLPLSLASLASSSSSSSASPDQGALLLVDLISLQAFGQIKAHDGPIAAVEITTLLPPLQSPPRPNEANPQGERGGEEGTEGERGGEAGSEGEGEGEGEGGGGGGGGTELLASASAKGTIIRVHCVRTGNKEEQ